MKLPAFILTLLVSTACLAADVIYLPNLQGSLTGSAVGSKKALDASVVNTVIVTPSPNPMPVTFPGGVTANQGTPGPAASPWPVVDDAAGATLTSIDGKTPALVGGRVPVDGSGVTQPVSAASLPLPTGAATEATLGSVDGYLSSIATFTGSSLDAALSTRASEATVSSIDGKTPALVGGRVPVDGSGVTQPVSATSLPLPTGAATEATLTSIDGKTPALVTGRVPVDGSGVTQPVSAASLPLPSGAATSALQTTGNTSLGNIETYTNRTPRNANSTDIAPGSISTTANTASASADAVGFILSADGANTDSIRYRLLPATATATAGHELEPGRDTGFIPAAAGLSIIAVSGTQAYQLTWVRR